MVSRKGVCANLTSENQPLEKQILVENDPEKDLFGKFS